jgi:hypothetical protein
VEERLAQKKWRSVEPRVVFDGEIAGPWTDYTSVWRVVLEPPTAAFLDPGQTFFYW